VFVSGQLIMVMTTMVLVAETLATLKGLADKFDAARRCGVKTGKAEDRLRGSRLRTDFVRPRVKG